MLYKFKSKVSPDLIMFDAVGARVLRIIGKEPGAKGIIEPAQMLAAVAALLAAIAEEEGADKPVSADDADEIPAALRPVSLKQRAWPFIEMLRRCHAADEPVVWGV